MSWKKVTIFELASTVWTITCSLLVHPFDVCMKAFLLGEGPLTL